MNQFLSRRIILTTIFLILLTIFLIPPLSPASVGQTGSVLKDPGVIYGIVKDAETNEYLENVTISVERELYEGNRTTTDANGFYEMRLPYGNFILRIYDEQGYVIFRYHFNITRSEPDLNLDFVLDSKNIDRSLVRGKVLNKFTYTPMSDAIIKMYRISADGSRIFYREDPVNDLGEFEIRLPAGRYDLEVWADNEMINRDDIELNFGESEDVEYVLQKPTRTFTLQNFFRLLQNEWLDILGIIIVLVIGLFLNSLADRVFKSMENQLEEKPGKFLDIPIVRFIERVVKWNIFIVMVIIIIYLIAQILDAVTILWIPISNSIPSIYTIILLIISLRIGLMIWRQFIQYLRGGEQKKPKKILSSRIITIIEIIGKYSLISIFVLAILLIALSALGMSDIIVGGLVGGLKNKSGFIIFIISLAIIAYIAVKFMTSFFEDMKKRTTRFRPEMIDLASKGLKYFIYGIIGMIFIFTLLSAAGMGEIGQTLIIVFSLIIGLVVSMAATGSIGNILSGIVIMSFKPFEEGDYVVIADKYTGQIIETNIMFTKIRDLENELIEIPNNSVLSSGIVNWTQAARTGGFAVEIDVSIGYDIPAKQVIHLLKDSCVGLENVSEFPKPNVVMTEFQNHAIGYKLRAYIKSPQIQFKTRTDIMINIQKKFTEAGVEILSPEFYVKRIGKIPLPKQIKGRMKKIKKFDEN